MIRIKDLVFSDIYEAVSYAKRSPEKEVIIFVKGVNKISKTIEFTNIKDKKIVLTSEDGDAVFDGGISLDFAKFKPVEDEGVLRRLPEVSRGKVLCYDLGADGISDLGEINLTGMALDIIPSAAELFIDDEAMQLAGFPNHGKRLRIREIVRRQKSYGMELGTSLINSENSDEYVHMDKDPRKYYGNIIKFDYDEIERWGEANDAVCYGSFGWGFADATMPIKKIDINNRTIEFSSPLVYDFTGKFYDTCRIINLLEEIDIPGEYYIDRDNRILYLYPPKGFSEKSKIQISMLSDPMVAIEDSCGVEIRNIVFENMRGMAIYSHSSNDTVIDNCTFRNIGMVAISFGIGFLETPIVLHNATLIPMARKIGNIKAHMWDNPYFDRRGGYNNRISNCHIYNIGCGGIILDGGNRYDLKPSCSIVDRCDIHDFNRIDKTYRPAVRLTGCGNTVSNCKLHDCPQQTIEFYGNEHTIENNEIYNACYDSYDNGAIYIGGHINVFRNAAGNRIIHNYFHDNGAENHFFFGNIRSETFDLYLDGQSSTYVFGNVFNSKNVLKAVFTNLGSHFSVIKNNVFIDTNAIYHHTFYDGCYSYNPYEGFDEEHKKLWREKYPFLDEFIKGNIKYAKHEITNNIHIGDGHFLHGADTVYRFSGNMYFSDDPGFEDMKNHDYRLRKDSTVFIKNPEFENVSPGPKSK